MIKYRGDLQWPWPGLAAGGIFSHLTLWVKIYSNQTRPYDILVLCCFCGVCSELIKVISLSWSSERPNVEYKRCMDAFSVGVLEILLLNHKAKRLRELITLGKYLPAKTTLILTIASWGKNCYYKTGWAGASWLACLLQWTSLQYVNTAV